MEKNELERLIREQEDFIHAPKHQNSLQKFLAKLEKPLEDNAIGRLLLISSDEVEALYQESIEELKKEMIEDDGDRDL